MKLSNFKKCVNIIQKDGGNNGNGLKDSESGLKSNDNKCGQMWSMVEKEWQKNKTN